jgi:NTP pyrophosphatase (non-canonical NTP hydrolase)
MGEMNAINQITQGDIDDFEISGAASRDNLANHYQRIATKSALYPGQGTPLGLTYCALKLNGEAGELAEHVGKAIRDDGILPIANKAYVDESAIGTVSLYETLTTERRELIIKEIGDCLWYLSALCNELGITLAWAMLSNLRKLADRTKRNALRGSGDER